MLILCPVCKKRTEIKHEERGSRIECVCGSRFVLNDQTVIQDFSSIDEPPPAQIGPYPILEEIGSGGMGKVYKGIHPQLKLPVAVKVLHRKYAENAELCERFVQSAKICAKLSHPNIVRVYDSGAVPAPYLVMEYIPGGTLLHEIRHHGPLSPRRTAEIALAVACALEEAAHLGIVHRDVKPDNIMLDSNGVCKLLDLGLAKIDLPRQTVRTRKNYTEETQSGGLGTLEYMAPEQAADAKSCDIRADIYSLGVTMYELATGIRPGKQPDTPLPPGLESIIRRCMAQNPDERYQTPQELRAALEIFLRRDSRPFFRSRKVQIAAVIVLLILLVLSVLSLILTSRQDQDFTEANCHTDEELTPLE